MIFLKVTEQTETDAKVVVINYVYQELSEEDKESLGNGFLVDAVLQPTIIKGKAYIHHINPITLEQWYEYFDIPKTSDEIRDEKIALMQVALDELILGV
jgi:hypothetical protein